MGRQCTRIYLLTFSLSKLQNNTLRFLLYLPLPCQYNGICQQCNAGPGFFTLLEDKFSEKSPQWFLCIPCPHNTMIYGSNIYSVFIFYTYFFCGENWISTRYLFWCLGANVSFFASRKWFLDFWVRRISVKSFCLNWIAVQMLFWVVIEKQSWGKLKLDRINSEMEKDQFYSRFLLKPHFHISVRFY